MSRYISVFFLDGISTTVCISMAADCAYEKTCLLVECPAYVRFFTAIIFQFSSSIESQDWWLPKNSDVILLKKTAHCVDDKPMAFLVTGEAGTKMKIRPVFFPHQAKASFRCQKRRKQLAIQTNVIVQIAANFVLERSTKE